MISFLVSTNNFLVTLGEIGLGLAVVFGLIALFVKNLRSYFGSYLYALSFVIGLATWLTAAFALYGNWGFIGFFIGLFIAGVGVVPVSMLSMMFHGQWMNVFALSVQLVLLFGCRFGSIALLHGEAKRQENLEQQKRDVEAAFYESLEDDREQTEL